MPQPDAAASYRRDLTYDLDEARNAMSRNHPRSTVAAVDRALARDVPDGVVGPREVVLTALAIGVVPPDPTTPLTTQT